MKLGLVVSVLSRLAARSHARPASPATPRGGREPAHIVVSQVRTPLDVGARIVSAGPGHTIGFADMPHFMEELSADMIAASTRRNHIASVLHMG